MSQKRPDKTPQPPTNDEGEGQWVHIDCGVDTGAFTILSDVPAVDGSPQHSGSETTTKRRTLDDMRRLSEEIKRKRESK